MRIAVPLRILAAATLLGLAPLAGWGAELAPELRERAHGLAPQERLPVVIRLREPLDLRVFREESERAHEGRRARRARLVRALQVRFERSSGALRALLAREGATRVRALWILNGVAAELPAGLLDRVAAQPEVESIRFDAVVRQAEPSSAATASAGWNLVAVGAPDLWSEGHTGQGVVVAHMDSGVDPDHPDIGPKQRPENSWLDPYDEHPTPYDPSGHGTQTLGLILGGDSSGQTIGMAPDARWIAVKLFDDAGDGVLSSMHEGYQWLLDPDGNPATDDVPDVVNNSWTLDGIGECESEFQADVAALRAADVAVVFSAGNFGPSPSTSVSPANNPGSLAVGAVDFLLAIASFSSRGPSACDAGIYPLLVAPGVNVHTADLTLGGLFPDSYADVTGTSFAAAHVSGALALLRGAHPLAGLEELEGALLSGAQDLGANGPDADSGWGLLDVAAAHQALGAASVPAIPAWGLALAGLLVLVAALRRV